MLKSDHTRKPPLKLYLWLIAFIGVIVPRRLRADWRQEWEAELRYRETLITRWDKLDWRGKLILLWHSLGAFADALWLQPRRWEDEMIQDLRFGFRMLLKNPGLTAVAIITLGLGIGANTAIFSVVNKALLRPLPVAEPERVVAINNTTGRGWVFPTFSYPNYRDLRDLSELTTGLIAYEVAPVYLSYDRVNERVWGYLVSGNYFETLGARAALGRMISPEEDRLPDAHPVAVISYRCWRQRFGADPSMVGRELIVNGRSFTVIGVAPPQFIGLETSYAPEIWFPMMMRRVVMLGSATQAEGQSGNKWLENRKEGNLMVAGRLKPGVSMAQAEAAFKANAAQLAGEYPNENAGMTIELSPPGLYGVVGRRWALGLSGALMGAVVLALLLVCANLANLLLARALDRRQEIAVRLAVGASRWRIVRQLLIESLLLSVCGGALGWLLAFWLTTAAGKFRSPMLSTELNMDSRVLVFAIAITFLTTAVFGLLPAWQATRPELVPALKGEAAPAGYRSSWLRDALVAAQVTFSLVLMISAGLLLRGLQRTQYINLGFNPQQAVKLSFNLDLHGYDRARGRQFQQQVLERVRALPETQAAGVGSYVPPDLHVALVPINIEGRLPERVAEAPLVGSASASPGYFQALGARLRAGRDFTEQDDERAVRVAVVNETFARRFWPGEEAIGKRFSFSNRDDSLIQVVGIVEDGKYRSLSEESRPFVFTPMRQADSGFTILVARTAGAEAQTLAAIQRELRQLDPHLPVYEARTLTEHLRLPLLPARVTASMLGGFGVLSLLLAAVGVFGVTSYIVSRRTHEIGVRLALGAQKGAVLGMLIRQGMRPVAMGIVFGLAGALMSTRALVSLLFGLSPTDPLTFAGVALLFVAVALLACYFPSRRAMKIDLLTALRRD